MNFFKKAIKKEVRETVINFLPYKVNIVYENRKNSRVSITKSGINIRIVSLLSNKRREEQIYKFLLWAEKTIKEKDISFPSRNRVFKNGDKLKLYDKEVILEIMEFEIQRVSGKINSEKISIKLPNNLIEEDKQKYISKILTRLLVKNYKVKISDKLHQFNEQFGFGEINSVRLKNNSTNWGSCSSKNNINISIRLLLAPESVLDYVLIHELCHLRQRNHSIAFWKLVEKYCPSYRVSEKWLKANSSKCII